MPRCHRWLRAECSHPPPQRRQAVEDRHCGCDCQKRGPVSFEISRSRDLAKLERIPPLKPRRDMRRSRQRSGGSFSRRLDALRQTVGTAPHGAELRQIGRGRPGSDHCYERLHRPWDEAVRGKWDRWRSPDLCRRDLARQLRVRMALLADGTRHAVCRINLPWGKVTHTLQRICASKPSR